MKKQISLILVTTLMIGGNVLAQAPDSTMTEKYLLDFVVPDIPAFKALGTDPSNILRPADAKKFAVALSPFYSNGQAVIPKNFALEFSPWKLASANWTLSDYSSDGLKRFLYNSSFSIGSVEDSTDFPNKLSVGYRVSFLSEKADVLRVANNIINIDQWMQTQEIFTKLTNYWVINVVQAEISERPTYYQKNKKEFLSFLSSISEELKKNPNPTLDKLYKDFVKGLGKDFSNIDPKDFIESFGKSSDKYIAKYKEENWNASRMDVALAWVGESNEETLSSAQFSSFSAWVTCAIRSGKNKQLLVGVNFVEPKKQNELSNRKISGNLRYYVGTQFFRGFLETQYMIHQNQPVEKSLLVNFGAELKVGDKFWVSAYGGVNNYLEEDNGFTKIVSGIDLKYGINKEK